MMKPDRAGGGIPSLGVALADSNDEDIVAAVDEAMAMAAGLSDEGKDEDED
jgi:hypothetical protein